DSECRDGQTTVMYLRKRRMPANAQIRRISDYERRREAAKLQAEGLTVGDIAAHMGVTPSAVRHMLKKPLAPRPLVCRCPGGPEQRSIPLFSKSREVSPMYARI